MINRDEFIEWSQSLADEYASYSISVSEYASCSISKRIGSQIRHRLRFTTILALGSYKVTLGSEVLYEGTDFQKAADTYNELYEGT